MCTCAYVCVCVRVCVSCAFSLTFSSVCLCVCLLLLPSSSLFGLVLSQFILLLFNYLISNKRKKGCGFQWKGRWGRSWRSWGWRNHNQNILYEKNCFNKVIKNEGYGSFPDQIIQSSNLMWISKILLYS